MENWSSIPGFLFCEASDLGRIRSVYPYSQRKNNPNKGKNPRVSVLKPSVDKKGYLYVRVFCQKRERRVHVLVHRLVAFAFLGLPDEKMEVNHLNYIKTDNRIANLEWVTRSDNVRHSFKSPNRKTPIVKINPDASDLSFIKSLLGRGVSPRKLNQIFSRIS
jgi:hypothetical protein